MRQFVQKIHFFAWSVPLALLAACILAFGLLIPSLGFYYDDWHFIYYATRGWQGLSELFNYDGHPLSIATYFATFNLLQYNPLAWHIFALFWRWMAVTMFWLCLKRLWPQYDRQTFTAALLFAIYPLFALQATPISYYEAWISFFILMLSFFLTLEAIRQPDKFWLFTILAILVKFAHIYTREYTWGTELMRLPLIWFMLPGNLSTRERLRKAFSIWLPYLLIFVAMVGWRALLYHGERKAFQAQTGLLSNPLETLLNLPNYIIPDFGLILFSSWYPIFVPKYLDLGNRSNLLLMILMVASAAALFFYLNRSAKTIDEPDGEKSWAWQALIIGFVGLLFGLIPAYGAGYSIYLTKIPINARLALGTLPGAALIITALLEMIVTRQRTKFIVIALLAGLLIGWHERYTLDFRNAWDTQARFYRQLTWRVPALKANTAILVHDEIFLPIREYPAQVAVDHDFPTALAINVIYGAKQDNAGRLPYWFFSNLDDINQSVDTLPNGQLYGDHVNAQFSSESKNTLVFSFDPQNRQCLQLLNPENAYDRRLPQALKQILPTVPSQGINPNAKTDFTLLDTILGAEDTNTWCYYYEKADLARQQKDWKTIKLLWDAANQKDLRALNEREYLPFVEAMAHLNDWDQALKITGTAKKYTASTGDLYCPLWKKLFTEMPASPEKDQSFTKAIQILKCGP